MHPVAEENRFIVSTLTIVDIAKLHSRQQKDCLGNQILWNTSNTNREQDHLSQITSNNPSTVPEQENWMTFEILELQNFHLNLQFRFYIFLDVKLFI